jgi:hypothetical protein
MKRAALSLLVFSLFACASSDTGSTPGTARAQKIRVPEPDIDFVQLVGPADLNYPSGDIEVQYGLRIANRFSEEITLRRIELRSLGDGGPYRLQTRPYVFKETVGADQFKDVIFWARAWARGDAFASDVSAPVAVRAVAYFDTPHGTIRKVMVRNFTQFGGAVPGR